MYNLTRSIFFFRNRSRQINRYLRDVADPFLFPEESFRKHYRLTREVARNLFLNLLPYINAARRTTKIPAVISSYQKPVGMHQHCSISQAAVSQSLHEIVDIFLVNIADEYIKVKAGFFNKFQFPGIVGCVDGTHIRIYPPAADHDVLPGRVYINRHGSHSINCQIICDSDLKILSINARYIEVIYDYPDDGADVPDNGEEPNLLQQGRLIRHNVIQQNFV
ncbi:hypothetical protein RI129_004825 [Pyrocoelia pectoralis]|uniref:Harbinger transposase-derived nuclease n=1 Tax=Pyrocoelia pectoralis TaxID=417401 RepID=A0AAN7VJ06_9COLE